MTKWDKLWEPELGGLPSTVEIILKSERYSPTMYPWLKQLNEEGDKMQEKLEAIEKWFVENYGRLGSFQSTYDGQMVIGDYFELKKKVLGE